MSLFRHVSIHKACTTYCVRRVIYLVEARLWNLSEVHDKQVYVYGQPERSEHNDHQHQSATCLTFLVDTAALLASSSQRGVTAA